MRFQNILFDLDGTLTESHEGITKSIQYALRKFGIEEENLQNLIHYIGPPLQETFMKHYSFDAEKAYLGEVYFREYFDETGIFENKLYLGVAEMLAELHGKGRKIALATAKPERHAKRILAHFNIEQYFTLIGGVNEEAQRLNKKAVIAYALDTLNSPIQETVMVGDHEHDILGAHSNGIPAIAVGYGYGRWNELMSGNPEYFVKNIEELRILLVG